jgi:hypothetical protein
MAPGELAAERPQFLQWLDTHLDSLAPDQLPAVREHLYFLLGSVAQIHYRATGRLFPSRDTLGFVDLLERGTRLGLYGTGLIARTVGAPERALTAALLPKKPLALSFSAPEYTIRSDRGWSLRFPYYFMIGAAYYGVPKNGIGTETVVLSTLFANHRQHPGHSQATILVVAAPSGDTAAFYRFWFDALGLKPSDRTTESLLTSSQTYRAFDADASMNKEVVTLVRGQTAFLLSYFGLPGPYEANRADFIQLLQTLVLTPSQP